jgi:hypothetical protein
MTARFGRNKRRAAREKIAELDALVKWSQEEGRKAIREARQERDRFGYMLDTMVDRLIKAFGEQSAFLPVYRSSATGEADIRRWPVKRKEEPAAMNASISYAQATVMNVNLLNLIAEIEESPATYAEFGAMIRFRDKNKTGDFSGGGLFISRESFQRHGVSEEELNYFIDSFIRPRLMQILNGGRRRG